MELEKLIMISAEKGDINAKIFMNYFARNRQETRKVIDQIMSVFEESKMSVAQVKGLLQTMSTIVDLLTHLQTR